MTDHDHDDIDMDVDDDTRRERIKELLASDDSRMEVFHDNKEHVVAAVADLVKTTAMVYIEMQARTAELVEAINTGSDEDIINAIANVATIYDGATWFHLTGGMAASIWFQTFTGVMGTEAVDIMLKDVDDMEFPTNVIKETVATASFIADEGEKMFRRMIESGPPKHQEVDFAAVLQQALGVPVSNDASINGPYI
jgi:hypothetical protein